ncbi:MAG: type III pantothenate kinase [Kiloniellales bacterium]|nr:type III pantothenate kinase [Kiloniellales bacterium]
MLLAIDIGNTNVVLGVFESGALRARWRATTDPKRTPDEYCVWLTQLMALQDITPKDIEGAIIASVVPAAVYGLETLCRRYFEVEPLVVGAANVTLGIEVRAQQAGADRLVNAVAGHRIYGGPLIVVDFGTATSFDVVAKDGGLEGCVLAPGVNLSVEALTMASAQLPRIAVVRPETVIGKSTVPAMQSGIFWGYVDMVEGMIARIKAETGWPMTVIATGGLSAIFAEACRSIDTSDPDLTLRGLELIYRANEAKDA